jgi:hypothetical protein
MGLQRSAQVIRDTPRGGQPAMNDRALMGEPLLLFRRHLRARPPSAASRQSRPVGPPTDGRAAAAGPLQLLGHGRREGQSRLISGNHLRPSCRRRSKVVPIPRLGSREWVAQRQLVVVNRVTRFLWEMMELLPPSQQRNFPIRLGRQAA